MSIKNILREIQENTSLSLGELERRGRELADFAKGVGQKAGLDMLKHQEHILSIMLNVKVGDLDPIRAQRNISYRKRQIHVIAKRASNSAAARAAAEWNQLSSDIITALGLIVRGLIL